MILRLVSILHGMPFSMREMVIGETFACLASSALLIKRDSLVFFNLFALMDFTFPGLEQSFKIVLINYT